MVHMESPHQGIYAPLSQAMTDSESEEEIHNSTKQRQQQFMQKPQQQQQHQEELNINSSLGSRNPTTPLGTDAQAERMQQSQQQLMQQQEQLNRQRQFEFHSHTSADSDNQPSSYTTNMQHTFRSVMMSDMGLNTDGTPCDPSSNFSSFNSDYDEQNQMDADNVAILGNRRVLRSIHPLSPRRRLCFIASLVLCVFAVIWFVWLVPCTDENTCPALADRVKAHNWLNNYTKIELKGGVNIVTGLRDWENNLIFLYRGDVFFPEFRDTDTKRNGIISLIGSSGAVAWYIEMVDEPIAIDCTLIDVDRNRRPDCLVMDEYGELGAIDPISGQWFWRFKERSVYKVDAMDFPIILPDLDGDGVEEMLLVTSVDLEKRTKSFVQKGDLKHKDLRGERNFLLILSGRDGQPLGDGIQIHDCEELRQLQLENSHAITYVCWRNETESPRSKTLAELFALITNKSIVGQKLKPASKISQHRYYGQRKDIRSQRNIYSLSGRELVVENDGHCPHDCNVSFVLSENLTGKPNVIRNFTSSSMYGMVPAQWHFRNTKSKMSGFVMKFWKWEHLKNSRDVPIGRSGSHNLDKSFIAKKHKVNNNGKGNDTRSAKQNQTQSNKTKKSRRKRELEHEFPTNQFDTFDRVLHLRSAFIIQHEDEVRVIRNIGNATYQKSGNNFLFDNYRMQVITETVVLVLFVNNNTRIENTSQSNVVQFCRNETRGVICQPDLNNQENSMIIADLDQDGSQELVSYMSTFVQSDDDPEVWKLITYVRLLRLQAELPTFYDNVEKHNSN